MRNGRPGATIRRVDGGLAPAEFSGTMKILTSCALAVALVALGACGDKKDDDKGTTQPATDQPAGGAAQPATPAATVPPEQEARQLFDTVCAACHGKTGAGDGPAAATLDPKPRNYSDPEWQATTTDEEIAAIIVKGGAGVGKSPMMPAQMQLANKPEVVNELVKIIRSFGPQDGAGEGDEGGEGEGGDAPVDEPGTDEG